MSEATGGHPERSARFRDLLTPAGLGPELRSAFVADGATWGALILVRRAGRARVRTTETSSCSRSASALFARAVRRGLSPRRASPPPHLPDAPGVIELDASGELIRASSSAEPLLPSSQAPPSRPACARPRSTPSRAQPERRSAPAARPHATLPSSAVKTPAGTWLVLHGGLLGIAGSGEVAVFIQRAHPTLVAPLLLKAYGLTRARAGSDPADTQGSHQRPRRRSGSRSRRTPSTTT